MKSLLVLLLLAVGHAKKQINFPIQNMAQLRAAFRASKHDDSILFKDEQDRIEPNDIAPKDFKVANPKDLHLPKINAEYPQPYYPNEVTDASQINKDDRIAIFDKDVHKQISRFSHGTDFFKDPLAELKREQPDGQRVQEEKTYPIYGKDKQPYYNRIEKRAHDYEQDTFKRPNIFAVGIVNADDIESHIQLRKNQIRRLLNKKQNYYDPARLESYNENAENGFMRKGSLAKMFDKPTMNYWDYLQKQHLDQAIVKQQLGGAINMSRLS